MQINMNDADFDHLYCNGTYWNEYSDSWLEQMHVDCDYHLSRFVIYINGQHRPDQNKNINMEFSNAYWFEDFTSLLIGRSFMESNHYPHQILSDESGGWVIITDYRSITWRKIF